MTGRVVRSHALCVFPFYLIHHLFFWLPLSSNFACIQVSFIMDPMLTINQFCEARYPSTRGDLPAPKHSILAIINTAQCLYNDFLTFQAHLPYSDTRKSYKALFRIRQAKNHTRKCQALYLRCQTSYQQSSGS